MKWVIISLFGLGLAAAICAAVLVASFNSDGSGPATTADGVPVEASILVATHDLTALTVIGAEDVAVRSVPRDAAPAAALADPVQAVGHVLVSTVQSGQALTPDSFVNDESAARLAATLKPGYRAVSVLLSDPMGMESLLSPGSVVDVLASIQMSSGNEGSRQEPVSITLLQSVQVLAVGNRSIVAPGTAPAASEGGVVSHDRPSVTLMVDARQAEKLKLAMAHGSVTLALRNPKDVAHVDVGGTDLPSLSPLFAYVPPASMVAGKMASSEVAQQVNNTPVAPVVVPQSLQRQWETVILRGGVAETRTFPQPEAAHDR